MRVGVRVGVRLRHAQPAAREAVVVVVLGGELRRGVVRVRMGVVRELLHRGGLGLRLALALAFGFLGLFLLQPPFLAELFEFCTATWRESVGDVPMG